MARNSGKSKTRDEWLSRWTSVRRFSTDLRCVNSNQKLKIKNWGNEKKKLNDRQECYCTCDCSFRKSGSWNSPLKTWKNKGPGLDVYSSNSISVHEVIAVTEIIRADKAWLLSPLSRQSERRVSSSACLHDLMQDDRLCPGGEAAVGRPRISCSAPDSSPSVESFWITTDTFYFHRNRKLPPPCWMKPTP